MTAIVNPGSAMRERLERIADGLAVATAVSLPWSTSATSILVALWLIVLIPTIDLGDLLDVLKTPAGLLPVALTALAVVGMLWADVAWTERWDSIKSFGKLCALPFLFVQFQRSDRGIWVFAGFLDLLHRAAGRLRHQHGLDRPLHLAGRQGAGGRREGLPHAER